MATRKSHILFIGFGHLAKSLLSPNLRKNYLIHYINSKKSICSVKDKKVIKILRPKKLSNDKATSFSVLKHSIEWLEKNQRAN